MSCIHDHELNHDLCFTSFLQFAHNQVQTITTLGDAKFRFHFVALSRLLDPVVPLLGIDILGRPSQFGANHRDIFALAEPLVLPGPVCLVSQNALRPATKTTKVGVALFNQQAAFAEIVPADFVDKGVAVLDTDRDLSAKLDVVTCFAANNRTDMRLGDTDNAIINPMHAFFKHLLLLQVQKPDRRQFCLFHLAQLTMSRHRQQLIQAFQIQTHVLELFFDRAAHLVVLPLALFDNAQKRFSGILHVHLRLLELAPERLEHLGDETFQHFPGLVEQRQVGGIADVLRRTGRVQNQRSIVVAAFFGWILLIVFVFVDTTQDVIDPGHSGCLNPLAKINKGRRADRWRGLEFRKAKKILNVGILRNRLGAFTIAKIEHRLDKQGAERQSGWLGNIAFEAGELAGIFLFDFIPGNNPGESDPTIVRVELSIPRGHEFKDTDLILLLQIHSSILRSAAFVVFLNDFRTIYYTIFRLKPPACRPLRFVEQPLFILAKLNLFSHNESSNRFHIGKACEMMTRRVTIKDVAKEANVSTATVSRVLNNNQFVDEEICKRVLEVSRKLGYFPDSIARSLKVRSTHTIGFMVSDISNTNHIAVARSVEDVIQAKNYSLILCSTERDKERERRYLMLLMSKNIDGLVLNTSGDNLDLVMEMNKRMPMVLINRRIEVPGFKGDLVDSNNNQGIYELTKQLLTIGHRKIYIVRGPSFLSNSRERFEGFARAMHEIGITVDENYPYVFEGSFTLQSGIQAVDHLCSLDNLPTAILSQNNMMTLGLLKGLRAKNINVPEDLSIVSFHGIENIDLMAIRPTVAYVDNREIGDRVGEAILERIADNTLPNREFILETKIITGNSVGIPTDNLARKLRHV